MRLLLYSEDASATSQVPTCPGDGAPSFHRRSPVCSVCARVRPRETGKRAPDVDRDVGQMDWSLRRRRRVGWRGGGRYTTAGGDEGEQMRMMSTPLGMLHVLSRQESYLALALTTGQYTSLGFLKSTSDWQVRTHVGVAAS
jgi:hypothetical protein